MIALLLWAFAAHAQIQDEPVEIITAAPPAVFSERAGVWPAERIPPETFTNDKTTLTDRWNTIPGVQAREQGSPTLSIRGSSQADRVLQLFDGSPLNTADGTGASLLFIPTEVMSDVSLIKGPASVFYGGGAMAGAVDYHLRYFAAPTLEGSLAAEDVVGDRHATLVLPFAIKDDKPHAQVSVMRERDPGNFPYDGGRRDSNSMDLSRATAATDFTLGSFGLSLRAVEGIIDSSSPGSLYSPFLSQVDQKGSLVTAQVSHAIGLGVASVRVTDARIWGAYWDLTDGNTTSYTSRTSLYADLNLPLGDSLLLRTFGDVSADMLLASYAGGSRFSQTDADFGETLQWAISPAWSLQPSYRYVSRFGQWLGALAAVNTSGSLTSSLKLSQGFRAPSLSERFGNFGTFRANAGLAPENSWSAELGTQFEEGHRYDGFLQGLGARLSAYYTRFDNLVDTSTIGAFTTKTNSGDAHSAGAEASFAYGFKVWMTSLGYNYLDGATSQGPLKLAPHHQAVASIAQLFGPILFEAKETYWSSYYDSIGSTSVELPSWSTFDFTLRTLALTSWEFRAGVLDLFNQSRQLTYGYPEAQRRFFIRAAREF